VSWQDGSCLPVADTADRPTKPSSGCAARSEGIACATGIAAAYPYQEPTGKGCRVFISHAGEQKWSFATFLKEGLELRYPALRGGGLFLDDVSLPKGGDSMKSIYTSMCDSFVGECVA
jgi:hypothetical protein